MLPFETASVDVSVGRIAALHGSPRKDLVLGRKPAFQCEPEIVFTAEAGVPVQRRSTHLDAMPMRMQWIMSERHLRPYGHSDARDRAAPARGDHRLAARRDELRFPNSARRLILVDEVSSLPIGPPQASRRRCRAQRAAPQPGRSRASPASGRSLERRREHCVGLGETAVRSVELGERKRREQLRSCARPVASRRRWRSERLLGGRRVGGVAAAEGCRRAGDGGRRP